MRNRLIAASFVVVLGALGSAGPCYAAGNSTELIAAVKNVSTQSDKLRSMMSNLSANQFHLVSARSVLADGDETAFRASIKKNASDISDLRDTLTHTTVTGDDGVVIPLRKLLLTKNVTIDQIVGVYVGSDGQITLFYQ